MFTHISRHISLSFYLLTLVLCFLSFFLNFRLAILWVKISALAYQRAEILSYYLLAIFIKLSILDFPILSSQIFAIIFFMGLIRHVAGILLPVLLFDLFRNINNFEGMLFPVCFAIFSTYRYLMSPTIPWFQKFWIYQNLLYIVLRFWDFLIQGHTSVPKLEKVIFSP